MSIALFLQIAALATSSPAGDALEVYTCEHLASESSKPHEPLRPDLTLQHKANGSADGSWTVIWPGKAPIEAQTFSAEFGSVGGSAAFRWVEDNGHKRVGFLSFSDLEIPDGSKGAFFSMGEPSLWQPPGFLCATSPTKKSTP